VNVRTVVPTAAAARRRVAGFFMITKL